MAVINSDTAPASSTSIWIGRILSGIGVIFLIFDGAIKLVPIGPVTETMMQLGYADDANLFRGIGILLLICTALYAYPATSILGAILLTGYLGGAMAAHLRIDSPVFTHLLFGFYLGVIIWGGLYLRDARLRELLPLRR